MTNCRSGTGSPLHAFSQVGTSNHSSCPSQYDSDEHSEKTESSQRQSIDCKEPQNLAPLSPHASHPFSGVLPRKIQQANAEYASTTGVTQAAPIITNRWLVEDDAASQSDTLNGTIFGNTIRAIPAIPTTKSNRPSKNGSAGLLFPESAANVPAAIANKPTRQARAVPCDTHCARTPGWILTA